MCIRDRYRIRAQDGFLTAGYTRSRIKPWALEGGREGSGNYVEVIKNGETERYSFVSGLGLTTDDVVRVVTASGGGFGDPAERDAKAISADVQNGFLSAEAAKEIYGFE